MIKPARSAEDFEEARRLFRAYGAYLNANPCGADGICISGFAEEIASLPGKFAAPGGVILLAWVDGVAAGCVAVRPNDLERQALEERSCEMKRLWIGEAYRSLGLGRQLVESALAWARTSGYRAMYLDTAPRAMPTADALYRRFGFELVDRYNDNPVPGIVFYRLGLE